MARNKTRVDAKEFLKSLEGYSDGVDKKTKEAVLKCALAVERDAKNGFKIQAKFICETKVRPEEGHLINCDGIMYGITGIKDIYSKGSVLELVVNG